MTADEVQTILDALECDAVAVTNKVDAVEALQNHTFCMVLLDLQIYGAPDSIKGHAEHGRSFLRELRRQCPEHPGPCHQLPVLVVTSNAAVADEAVSLMREGADDVVQKGTGSRVLSDAVRRALEQSGRSDHAACAPLGGEAQGPAAAPITLSIPGDRQGRRVMVAVNDRPVAVTESSLATLMHLMVAYAKGGGVHKKEMGGSDERGYKGISKLLQDLRPVLGAADELIENDCRGRYRLSARVVLGPCETQRLAALDNPTVAKLASGLEGCRRQSTSSRSSSVAAPIEARGVSRTAG